MSLSKQQILERLRSTTRQDFLNSPYFRFSGMTSRKLMTLLKSLSSGEQDLAGRLRPLFLMSVSREIQSMAENFSGNNSKISDKEACDRANAFVYELLNGSKSELSDSESELSDSESRQIKNKNRYPNVDWLDEARTIGTFAGKPLVLLGHEQGTDDPIVACDENNDPCFAQEFSGLLTAQDPIVITGSLDR